MIGPYEYMTIASGDYALFSPQPPVSLVIWDTKNGQKFNSVIQENTFYEQCHQIP